MIHIALIMSMPCMCSCACVQLVDFGPLAVRRTAWEAAGGLDETLSDKGNCGIFGEWHL